MLGLFTDRARQVVVQASDTARALGHEFVGAEHLLLGLIADRHGVAAQALQSLGVTEVAVRDELLARHPQGGAPAEGMLPFTAEGKSVLERSLVESKRLGNSRIETEHMLLGLLKTEPQSGVELLEAVGLDAERVRLEIFRVLTVRQSLLADVHSPSFGRWETVGPDEHLRKLLIDAAELAVYCGRSTIEADDVLFAIAQDPHSMPLLADLGIQVERISELLERHRSRRSPPDVADPN